MRGPVLTAMLGVLVVGGPFGAFAVALSMWDQHRPAITVVVAVAIALGAWVTAALLVLLLEIRDSLRALASGAHR